MQSGNTLLLTMTPAVAGTYLEYEAGQYVSIGFKRSGRRTPMRSFSIVSSPTDRSSLEVAMKVEGNYTTAASDLHAGDAVYVQGPYGEFTINPDYDKRVVMVAGGIGVTPFISMIRWVTEANLPISLTLLYAVKKRSDIAFTAELVDLQRRNPSLRIAYFVSQEPIVEANDSMVGGYIDSSHLLRASDNNLQGVTYFVCGPKGFMEKQHAALRDQGVHDDRIITESFSQSSSLSLPKKWTPTTLTYAMAAAVLFIGVGGIMVLDLMRSVPKLVSKQTAATTSTTASTTQTGTVTNQDTTSATTTPTTSNDTTTSQTNDNSSANNYSAPVSSVS